ncbi:MAG: SCP2 domain-containing protein [Methylophagaceae bacterium]
MSTLLKPIELAINATLAQDPETQAKLDQFEQRCIAIHIKDFNQTITMSVIEQQLQLSTDTGQTADLTITANALTLAKLGRNPDNLFSAEIDINGDVQFAKQLRDLLNGFDFDWEAQLAKVTGDTLAYPIAYGIREFAGWAKNTHQSMQQNIAEYLREEARILPDKSQIKDYMTDIDKLRADFDRLEARINRLQGSI